MENVCASQMVTMIIINPWKNYFVTKKKQNSPHFAFVGGVHRTSNRTTPMRGKRFEIR